MDVPLTAVIKYPSHNILFLPLILLDSNLDDLIYQEFLYLNLY
jgi:hypothetical protein